MGSIFSSFFGTSYKTPDTPEITTPPSKDSTEAESAATRDEEKRRLRSRKALSGTILTSPMGASGGNGILGRIGNGN